MYNRYIDLLAYFGIGGAHPGGFALTQSILENQIIQPFQSVLDIGCGTGQTSNFIYQKFNCQITAVDNHLIMLEKARERFKGKESNVDVIKGNAQNLNLMDNSFDFIVAESVIIFTEISKTLSELSRVLKSDGCMLMIEMTAEQSLSEELQRKVCSLYGINEILTEDVWTKRLQQAGFRRIEIINTPVDLIPSEITDINQSENINLEFFDLWDEHNNFIKQHRQLIGFRAFRCYLT